MHLMLLYLAAISLDHNRQVPHLDSLLLDLATSSCTHKGKDQLSNGHQTHQVHATFKNLHKSLLDNLICFCKSIIAASQH